MFSNKSVSKQKANVMIAAWVLAGSVGTANAAIVSAGYEGVIDSDSGLGLIGETMRFEMNYDDSISPTSSITGGYLNDHGYFTDYLTDMTVSIGIYKWIWDGSNSGILLTNDGIQTFSIGTEDRVTASASGYYGSALVDGAGNYSSVLYLSDNSSLTGLASGQVLPNPAPNSDLFTRTEGTSLVFSFSAGDPETGRTYHITTGNVANIQPVPIPAAVWLFGSGMLALLSIKNRFKLSKPSVK